MKSWKKQHFLNFFNFEGKLTPFKHVGFFKMGFKSFNRFQGLTYVKIKKLFGAVFFNRILVNWKVEKNNKYWILGTYNYSKPILLYINRFGFLMRIFYRRQTEKIHYSSKDTFEKLKIFNVARFSYIFNFKSHLTPFKHVGFFKMEFKRFN